MDYENIGTATFDIYSPDDDHVLYIREAWHTDIKMYYVIMEDAHRTPTADVMTSEQIKEKYNINITE